MKTRNHFLLALLCASVTFFSCSKDEIIPGTDPSIEKILQVQFTENTIPLNTIDSVFVIFKLPGSVNTLKRKMIATGNFYTTFVQDLSPASYDAEIRVYVKKEPIVTHSYMYKLKLSLALPLSQTTTIAGPNGKYMSNWSPNFVFRNAEKKVELIVAERVDDPFFEIHATQLSGYKLAGLDRSTFGGNPNTSYLADHGNWISPNNPLLTGSYTDATSFAAFAQRMQSKDWYRAEIDFMLDDQTNSPIYFHHTYYTRP